jgi:Na+/serine symporter
MYLVAIGWMYVVLMMAIAEALSPQGGLLGAFFTLLLYGVLPLMLLLYIVGTPLRRRRAQRLAAQSLTDQANGGGQPAGAPVTPVGKEG